MSNVLLTYMKNRFDLESTIKRRKKTAPGPVVTISREYGCPAKQLAEKLSAALDGIESEHYTKNHWHWIAKEILDESARELNLNPNMVREAANEKEKGVVNDIVKSLSHKYYPGEIKIKKTIGEVIRTFAVQGHVIIVGRGGVSITRDIPDSLHIQIMAPLEWRVNNVSKRQEISLAEARKKIQHIDTQRELIRQFFIGKKAGSAEFDVIFNYMTLDEEDIIASVIRLMETKDLI